MKKFILYLLFFLPGIAVFSEEGMWIPLLLEKLNIKQMQDMGLKLSAEDIYSVNHSSLKDAIVQFGNGCTAEIISPDGLILTNHHCALGSIQRLSSLEHDWLKNGFWSEKFEDELPCPGMTVTLLIRMEDVTDRILQHVTDDMNQLQRQQVIRENQDKITSEAVKGTSYDAKVRSFFYGNQFYLIVSQVYRDVRLVGAPPFAIGQFGGDTDNWMWPRHGGDFSLFRIYVNKNNDAADYSKGNVPYHPKKFLPLSLKGYDKGDFTFVFGYPGTTREYLTSYGIALTAEKENPVRISIRQKRLDIINAAMDKDPRVRIQYTSKHQGIANGWKKMIGETRGIKGFDGIVKKQQFEQRFQSWADSLKRSFPGSEKSRKDYTELLNAFRSAYREYDQPDMASVYLTEAGMGIEIVRYAAGFREFVKKCKSGKLTPETARKEAEKLGLSATGFFRDYSLATDRKMMPPLLKEMSDNMDDKFLPEIFRSIREKFAGNYSSYSADAFGRSIFPDSARLKGLLRNFRLSDWKKIENDRIYQLAVSIYDRYETITLPLVTRFSGMIDSLERIYTVALMEMEKGRNYYPDANGTLRVSYGKVDDYSPKDATRYNYFTTSDGILEKEDTSVYDYAVDPKLKSLLLSRDFGRYADRDGALHVAFTACNHTTGGNSGSPVLDAYGNLIGLNFDRNWEGTMSDLMYDPGQCRNIAVDIRYCLFIIDKFAGAKRLINEMKILE